MPSDKGRRQRKLWLLWTTTSIALIGALVYLMTEGENKQFFMPGPMSDGHHQIGIACESCHRDPLAGRTVLQQACIDCHGEERRKPFDSHPRSKFRDPRNADRLESINALECTTCHVEHQPEITGANGLTQPVDFCVHCHADIGTDRPSHRGMDFASCADAGCHNFHNNRALYTDFLLKHLHEPDLLERRTLPAREFASMLEELPDYPLSDHPRRQLSAADADNDRQPSLDAGALADWAQTAHARSGVNCSGCHAAPDDQGEKSAWNDHPGVQACAGCHQLELTRFERGKHGMRLAAGLTPMTPAQARLPMRENADHLQLTCTSCHTAHRFDVRHAAVEACLGCHTDRHSLAYKQSAHYRAWRRELAGEAASGSGVSCAGCHMPRVEHDINEWSSRIMVEHNQNATLSPNEKMLRPVCLHCHGLGFSLNALADRDLIERNFDGTPRVDVRSMEMAETDLKRASQEAASAR